MSHVKISDLTAAVATTLRAAENVLRVQDAPDLTESIPETPLIQVYAEEGEASAGSQTDRKTFGGGTATPVRQRPIVVHIDIYGRTRSMIGEDLAKATIIMDAVLPILEAQNAAPFFGNKNIQSFRYTWKRTTFKYGDPEMSYVGYRIVLTLTVF